MKYYLKRCGRQELGSVGTDGRAHRGRYLLISKKEVVQSMFPPLSTTERNDSALIPIIPLYSGEKTYCKYVYNNDEYHGSTAEHPRNELRLYLNKAFGNDQEYYFRKGDILVMRKENIDIGDGETQEVFFVDCLHDHTSPEYTRLDSVITETLGSNNGHGFYEGELSFFESQVQLLKLSAGSKVVVDSTVTESIVQNQPESLARLFANPGTFRDFIMESYGNLCAITGTVIRHERLMNLEAAHIKPQSHGGLNLPSNGLALSRDLHWAFDKGFFTLNDNLEVQVHPNITSDYLRSLNGKRIRIPSISFFRPDLEFVRYHRDSVYGLFLTSGRL